MGLRSLNVFDTRDFAPSRENCHMGHLEWGRIPGHLPWSWNIQVVRIGAGKHGDKGDRVNGKNRSSAGYSGPSASSLSEQAKVPQGALLSLWRQSSEMWVCLLLGCFLSRQAPCLGAVLESALLKDYLPAVILIHFANNCLDYIHFWTQSLNMLKLMMSRIRKHRAKIYTGNDLYTW